MIDVGAQIGQFSLFAAKLGRDVVAIEPFFDNIIRFHKAAVNENVQGRIRLITNAVSDQRGQVVLMQRMDNNIGGQHLSKDKDQTNNAVFARMDRAQNKYLVETILFDDILDFLPRMPNKEPYKKVCPVFLFGSCVTSYQ